MLKRKKTPLGIGFFVFVFCILLAQLGKETLAALPPYLEVHVKNLPSDVEAKFEHLKGKFEDMTKRSSEDGEESFYKNHYYWDYESPVIVHFYRDGQEDFSIQVPEDQANQSYINIYLDYENKEWGFEEPTDFKDSILFRNALISLLIEGIAFFNFGFRELRSWLVFIVTNVVISGIVFPFLHIVLIQFQLQGLILAIVLAFLLELLIFYLTIRELDKGEIFKSAIFANFLFYLNIVLMDML